MTQLKVRDGSGGWVQVPIMGPKGDTGPQGSIGPTGPTGAAAPRIRLESLWHDGSSNSYPSGSWTFTTPFKCDLGVFLTLSFWANSTGFNGYTPKVDGVGANIWCDHYFNFTAQHMTVATSFVFRALAAGTHTISYAISSGNPQCDGNDRAHWQFTMVEVP